jgi:hypothetical protein
MKGASIRKSSHNIIIAAMPVKNGNRNIPERVAIK